MTPRQLAWVVLVAIAAWLLMPLAFPAHVEGFSASIVSIGLHLAHDHVGAYDVLHPANLEFFGLSRLGTSLVVALFASLPGISGDGAMRLTMWLGLALLLGGTWTLVRRWTRAEPVVIAAAMLLVPGMFENSFFYNDNVLSAGLAVASLAIIAADSRMRPALLAGVLYGLAILARTDAVLLAPAIALVAFQQQGVTRAFWLRAAAFALAAIIPYAGILAAFGATPLDVLRISQYAVVLWNHGPQLARQRLELLIFIGLPGLLLCLVGTADLARRRDWHRLALLAGVPVLFNLVYLGKLYQSRQALPLAPCIVSLVIVGWQWILAPERKAHTARAAQLALGIVVLFTLTGPVTGRIIDDGPRVTTGRLVTIPLWMKWQGAVNRNIHDIRRLASFAGTRVPTAILTDSWDADRYLHLALLEEGYTVVSATAEGPACTRTAELFQRGDRRVLHIRAHEPFIPYDVALRPQRFDQLVMPCIASANPARLVLLTPDIALPGLLGDSVSTEWSEAEKWTYATTRYAAAVAIPMDPMRLARLRASYGALAAHEAPPLADLATTERRLGAQVGFPR